MLLDDKKARRIASQLDIKIIGTLGILLLAKKSGIIPLIKPLMSDLTSAGFRISETLYEEALKLSGEL
jgi:predicted nucleic acid-binding protein